jgi:hypothetical protein
MLQYTKHCLALGPGGLSRLMTLHRTVNCIMGFRVAVGWNGFAEVIIRAVLSITGLALDLKLGDVVNIDVPTKHSITIDLHKENLRFKHVSVS